MSETRPDVTFYLFAMRDFFFQEFYLMPLAQQSFSPKTTHSFHPCHAMNTSAMPRDVASRFGRRLRQLRRERNLTQLGMAVDFGIDRSFISDVERGRKSMSLPMLEVVALGLQVSLSDLLRDL